MTNTDTDTIPATPTKLRNGTWGARTSGKVAPGDIITIVTRAGKRWKAQVEKVVWTNGDVSILATTSLDRSRASHSRRRRAPNGECTCGACDDLLSIGYRPGQRIRCPECGGWADAY